MRQFETKHCIALHASGLTKEWSDEKIARLQLFQKKILFDKTVYLKAIQNILKRPVFEHEIAFRHGELCVEYLATGASEPTIDEFLALIPKEKWYLIGEAVN